MSKKRDDVKEDKPKTGDEMSLADLLGGSSDDDGPKRVDERKDEPNSGMLRLSQIVAETSLESAKTPSLMPPPPGPVSSPPPAPVAAPAPVVVQAPAKSQGPIYALIAVVVVGLLAGGYFLMNKGDDEAAKQAEMQAALEKERQANQEALEKERQANQEAMAKMMAALEEMKKGKPADSAVSAEEQAKMAAIQKQIDDAKAKEAELQQKAAATDDGKKVDRPKTDAPKTDAPKVDRPKADAPKADAPKTDAPKADAPKAGAADLDALLGGGDKKPEAKPEAKPAAGGDLPSKPDRAQVAAAMGPVAAKAQAACAKYSTGTVQVKLTVGSDGKVKASEALGAFANSTAGKCVAGLARTAKFPKFSSPTFEVTYPIVLK